MPNREIFEPFSDGSIGMVGRDLLDGNMQRDRPHVFVIFGASGDLAKNKIYPTLWHLFRDGYLPKITHFIGFARSDYSVELLAKNFRPNCKIKNDQLSTFEDFLKKCVYIRGEYDKSEGFEKMDHFARNLTDEHSMPTNRLFYLSLPPSMFSCVTLQIKSHCMAHNHASSPTPWTRLVLEKPFGRDSESSAILSRHLAGLFTEQQIYRIDHYLGKEMVQNLMVLRFANRLFDPFWNGHHIASVTISFKEPFGTKGRGGYFDSNGIIRDVMQNHMMQILSLFAMEKPASLEADDIRNEKVQVLKTIKPIELQDVILGQYVGDVDSSEEDCRQGYLDDPTIPPDSRTCTYALAVLHIDNPRWQGVPFFLKAGKALNERKTEIRVQFHPVSSDIYPSGVLKRTELVIRVQPNEAMYIKFMTKKPGMGFQVVETEMDLTYQFRYSDMRRPEAYERLLSEVFCGSQINFVRSDELDFAWRIFSPLLKTIENQDSRPIGYIHGRGPVEADNLMNKYGFVFSNTYKWTSPQQNKL